MLVSDDLLKLFSLVVVVGRVHGTAELRFHIKFKKASCILRVIVKDNLVGVLGILFLCLFSNQMLI